MSLTTDDIKQIRTIVREEARIVVREELESSISTRIEPRFDNIEGRLETVENDIKDIYEMISDLQKLTRRVAHFEKYNLEQKVIASYKQVVAIATEAGIKLPPA